MDRDNAPSTATQANQGMTRRGVMRRTAIGVGAAATLGATATGSAAAVNLPSRDTVITAAGFAISPPLWAAKQVYDRLTDTATGEDVDDELQQLNQEDAVLSVRSDAVEMNSTDTRVLTSIGNVLSGLDRTAYQKGIEVALNKMDNGAGQTTVEQEAVGAAMGKITNTQKNVADHFSVQTTKAARLVGQLEGQNLGGSDIVYMHTPGRSETFGHFTSTVLTGDVDLADGGTYSYDTIEFIRTGGGSGSGAYGLDFLTQGTNEIRVKKLNGGTPEKVMLNLNQFQDIITQATSIGSTVETDILDWISTVYPKYNSGDVALSELVTADQLAALASEQNDRTNVTADLAALGIPINDRTKLTIEIVAGENSGTIIDGNLAVSNPPTDGFIVGDTYDPATLSGPVWLMYDRTKDDGTTEGDIYQLQSQFKVIDAEGYDGEPVSNVTFEDKTTERYSTDIQELNAELDRLAEYQKEIQEERDALIEEETSGGGGGFLSGVGQGYTLGLAALGGGVLYLLGQK